MANLERLQASRQKQEDRGYSEPTAPVVTTPQRDTTRETETINKLGLNPSQITPDVEKDLFEATYSPEELNGISDYKQLVKGQSRLANQAQQQLGEAQSAFTSFKPEQMMGVLEEALRTKTDVGAQKLGTSDLFDKAGIPQTGVAGFATLQQSLNQNAQEMQDRYGSFTNVLDKAGKFVGEEYKALADNYKFAIDQYNDERTRLDGMIDNIVKNEQAMSLMQKQHDLQKEASEWSWNLEHEESNNKPSGTASSSDTSEMYDMGTGNNSDNCVLYTREEVTNLPYGLFTKQDKRNAIAQAGVMNDGQGSMEGVQIGDAILTSEGKWGHAAKVMDIVDGKLILDEANYKSGKITQGRSIDMNDAKIYGYVPNTGSEAIQISEDTNNLPVIEGQTGEGVTEGIDKQIEGLSGGSASQEGDYKNLANIPDNWQSVANGEAQDFVTKVMRLLPVKLKDSEKERLNREKEAFADYNRGRSIQEVVDEMKGFIITNDEDKDLALTLRSLASGSDLDLTEISAPINLKNPVKAMTVVENANLEKADNDFNDLLLAQTAVKRSNEALELLKDKDLRGFIGSFDRGLNKWTVKVPGKAGTDKQKKATKLAAILTDIGKDIRKEFLGSAITPAELETLRPFLAQMEDQPETIETVLANMQDSVLSRHNSARNIVGLPEVDIMTLIDNDSRLDLYRNMSKTSNTKNNIQDNIPDPLGIL